MHQYLDSDGSGTNPTCVSSTIGAERLANATAWLQQNNMKGFLGEIGAGSNSACICEYLQKTGTHMPIRYSSCRLWGVLPAAAVRFMDWVFLVGSRPMVACHCSSFTHFK